MREGPEECMERAFKQWFELADRAGMLQVGQNTVTSFHAASVSPNHPISASFANFRQYLMSRSVYSLSGPPQYKGTPEYRDPAPDRTRP